MITGMCFVSIVNAGMHEMKHHSLASMCFLETSSMDLLKYGVWKDSFNVTYIQILAFAA
jgi:hypothetical protein